MNQIFNDKNIEREFLLKGYAVRPFLEAVEITELIDLYTALAIETPSGFHATSRNDGDDRQRIHDGLTRVMGPKLKAAVPRYKWCTGAFVAKRPEGEQGEVPLHQDYSFADHEGGPVVHIWCPLVDVDAHNGCLQVVPGSHTFFNHISATPLNPSPYAHLLERLSRTFTINVPMAAGEALFFDGRLLHSSNENSSMDMRLACGCAMIPNTEAFRIYSWHETESEKLDVFEVSVDFLSRLKPKTTVSLPYPAGVSYIKSIYYAPQPFPAKALAELEQIQTELLGDFRPESVKHTNASKFDKWFLDRHLGAQAELIFPGDDSSVMRLQITCTETDRPWCIQLCQTNLAIVEDNSYLVTLTARADASRNLNVAVGQAYEPWHTLGLYSQVQLTCEWQTFTRVFSATSSDDNCRLYFDAGASRIDLELKDISPSLRKNRLYIRFGGALYRGCGG